MIKCLVVATFAIAFMLVGFISNLVRTGDEYESTERECFQEAWMGEWVCEQVAIDNIDPLAKVAQGGDRGGDGRWRLWRGQSSGGKHCDRVIPTRSEDAGVIRHPLYEG